MKTVFITGAGGFIGRHVVARALQEGHVVRALVRDPENTVLQAHPSLHLVKGSLEDVPTDALSSCDVLIHMAAFGVTKGMNDWDQCFQVNVIDSLALWRRAADAGVKRYVICGSCFEYGRSGERYTYIPVDAPLEPTGAYHASKAAATMAACGFAADKNIELVILRPFHVFGEGESTDRFWPSLKRAALAGEDFPMTCGEQIRDFMPVESAAQRFVEAVSNCEYLPGTAGIHNLGTGRPQSLLLFAQEWWTRFRATGRLLPGSIQNRKNEVMRYVPQINNF